jgi:hypothetical protein
VVHCISSGPCPSRRAPSSSIAFKGATSEEPTAPRPPTNADNFSAIVSIPRRRNRSTPSFECPKRRWGLGAYCAYSDSLWPALKGSRRHCELSANGSPNGVVGEERAASADGLEPRFSVQLQPAAGVSGLALPPRELRRLAIARSRARRRRGGQKNSRSQNSRSPDLPVNPQVLATTCGPGTDPKR